MSGEDAQLPACESPDPEAQPAAGESPPPMNPPESPNTNRPKPPLRKPGDADASAAGPATPAESEGPGTASGAGGQAPSNVTLDDQTVLKHIDSLVEKSIAALKIEELVERRVKAVGIEQRVEARVDQAVPGLVESSVASKDIEKLVERSVQEKDVKKLVDESVAARSPEKMIERRLDAAVERRVSSQDIDAMIVASVATRDMVKNVEPKSVPEPKSAIDYMEQLRQGPITSAPSAPGADHITALVNQKQSESEQRVFEKLSGEVQTTIRQHMNEVFTPMPISRPPTSPRPFSSNHQARSTPQTKANWTSGQLYTVAAVPNHDPLRALTHADLERDLTEKVLVSQPDRSALGFNEIVMRDIANSVVRELVGIFESLLDRLLIEKKQDTLRTLVSELVTEDTLKIIATSRDQLRQREIGHVNRELERLGLEARQSEANWEARFGITQELRDSQDDLYATLDERCRGIEGRLGAVEQGYVPRAEMENRLQEKANEIEALRAQVTSHRVTVDSVSAQLAEQQRKHTEHFATRGELAECQRQLSVDVNGCHSKIAGGLQELRDFSLPKADLHSTKTDLEERLLAIDKKLFEATQDISEQQTVLRKAQRYSEETFCTKIVHDEAMHKLEKEKMDTNSRLSKQLSELDAVKAASKDVDELRTALRSSINETNQMVSKASSGLDRTTGVLMALEQRVDQSFATRRYVDDAAKNLVDEVVQRSDAREELGRLWKEFEAERERLRQTVRQQQHARQDLNDAIEDIQSLRNGTGELGKRCDHLDDSLRTTDTRESSHWDQGQESQRAQKQKQDELELFYKALRDEFMSTKEFHRAAHEKLKQTSTISYFEQIDKALRLHDSIEETRRENKELNDTVRSIKLPTL